MNFAPYATMIARFIFYKLTIIFILKTHYIFEFDFIGISAFTCYHQGIWSIIYFARLSCLFIVWTQQFPCLILLSLFISQGESPFLIFKGSPEDSVWY